MGRPKGSLNKSTIAKLQAQGLPVTVPVQNVAYTAPRIERPDTEVLEDTKSRFRILAKMIDAAGRGKVNGVIASGSPGIGKSSATMQILESVPNARVSVIKGVVSAIELYTRALEHCNRGDVLLIDDSDRVFESEETMNILKALTDTTPERKVTWLTANHRFTGDNAIPTSFVYQGSVIFLTNKNLDAMVSSKAKHAEHIDALMSRAYYVDLKLHTRREVMLWVREIVRVNKILMKAGLSHADQEIALNWLDQHRETVTSLSIRTAEKLANVMQMYPQDWTQVAEKLLVRKGE